MHLRMLLVFMGLRVASVCFAHLLTQPKYALQGYRNAVPFGVQRGALILPAWPQAGMSMPASVLSSGFGITRALMR